MQSGATVSPEIKKATDRRSDRIKARNPLVYFFLVNPDSQPMIKIGFTTDYEKRLAAHRASKLGVAVKIQELCALKASQADEGAIHGYFAKHLVAGEQEVFHPHEEVTDYIRWLRDQYFVWVPDETYRCSKCDFSIGLDGACKRCEFKNQPMPPQPIADCEAVEPAAFLPAPSRRKTPGDCGPLFAQVENVWDSLYFPSREVTADDFYTNPAIILAARETLQGFDLDPASHAVANRVVRAAHIYTPLRARPRPIRLRPARDA